MLLLNILQQVNLFTIELLIAFTLVTTEFFVGGTKGVKANYHNVLYSICEVREADAKQLFSSPVGHTFIILVSPRRNILVMNIDNGNH